jgi:CRP-like cAMP-binding protein
MAYIDLLKTVDAFQPLNDDELAVIETFCTQRNFSHGDRLFKDGEAASHLWIVAEGLIDLRFDLPGRETSEESTLSSVSENKIIGWSSLVPPYKYKLSAYCASNQCNVVMIEREQLHKFLIENPKPGYQVLSAMLRVVGRRFQNLQETADDTPFAPVKVTVHMATCGISAGARDVMTALSQQVAKSGNERVQVSAGGCIGKCWSEPNVTVEIQNEGAVIYQKMDPDKIKRVFTEHIVKGRVQNDWVLEGGKND